MTDATTQALIARIEELAIERDRQAATISTLCADLEAERDRAARLEAAAKGVHSLCERLNKANARIAELDAAAPAQRRIDVVTLEEAEAKVAHLGHTAPQEGKTAALIRWLREPVGGAS